METQTKETKWTTLSVEKELRPLLDEVMIKMGKKLSYNQIITRLAMEYLK
jgi:hypothetical protein